MNKVQLDTFLDVQFCFFLIKYKKASKKSHKFENV